MHSKSVMHSSRPRYFGIDLPVEISRPIRAGILFQVDLDNLRNLVIELLVIREGSDRFSMETQILRADSYIGIISGFSTVELLDNCFWGDGVHYRGKGVPFQWQKKRKSSTRRAQIGMFPYKLAVIIEFAIVSTHIFSAFLFRFGSRNRNDHSSITSCI